MSTTVMIRDSTLFGQTLHERAVDLITERITVRELIRTHVYQEVQDHNVARPARFQGVIQSGEAERTLNGPRPTRAREIDWQRQLDHALSAFRLKQILIFVNERQVLGLDEEIEIKPGTEISFLRLTLLTGG